MKKIIEKQNKKERVVGGLTVVLLEGDLPDELDECLTEALEYIEELTTLRWETPEQCKKRTGEAWLDKAPVYALTEFGWIVMSYNSAKMRLHYDGTLGFVTAIVCATEAGPPPDGWEPEDMNEIS
jgi:hypothetical protein